MWTALRNSEASNKKKDKFLLRVFTEERMGWYAKGLRNARDRQTMSLLSRIYGRRGKQSNV